MSNEELIIGEGVTPRKCWLTDATDFQQRRNEPQRAQGFCFAEKEIEDREFENARFNHRETEAPRIHLR
jgi:hypothetical protein